MKINRPGKQKRSKSLFLKIPGLLIAIIFGYFLFSLFHERTGYLVWTSDAVLFTKLDYNQAVKSDFSDPSWGKWYYVEQDSGINKLYSVLSRHKMSTEFIFQKVKLNYINFIFPCMSLPTHIDRSHISRIHIFNIRIIDDQTSKRVEVEKDIPVYIINKRFQDELSRLIKLDTHCSYFDTVKTGYVFHIFKQAKSYLLTVNSKNVDFYDFSKCYGVFRFNGHLFMCEGVQVDEILLRKNKEFMHVKYLKSDPEVIPIIDDSNSSWAFKYSNNKFTLIAESVCSQ